MRMLTWKDPPAATGKAPPANRRGTRARIAISADDRSQGASGRHIAGELGGGISRNAVLAKRHRLGIVEHLSISGGTGRGREHCHFGLGHSARTSTPDGPCGEGRRRSLGRQRQALCRKSACSMRTSRVAAPRNPRIVRPHVSMAGGRSQHFALFLLRRRPGRADLTARALCARLSADGESERRAPNAGPRGRYRSCGGEALRRIGCGTERNGWEQVRCATVQATRKGPRVEQRALPTPERMRRAGTDVERGDSGQITMREAPLERAFARNVVTEEQYSAGQKYRHHWYHAGLADQLRSIDLDRECLQPTSAHFCGDGEDGKPGFPSATIPGSRQAAGKIGSHVLDWAVCREVALEQVGYALGWSSRPQAYAAAAERMKAALDEIVQAVGDWSRRGKIATRAGAP